MAQRALPRLFQWSGFLPFSNEHFLSISRTIDDIFIKPTHAPRGARQVGASAREPVRIKASASAGINHARPPIGESRALIAFDLTIIALTLFLPIGLHLPNPGVACRTCIFAKRDRDCSRPAHPFARRGGACCHGNRPQTPHSGNPCGTSRFLPARFLR
jgi:hypothetical protein